MPIPEVVRDARKKYHEECDDAWHEYTTRVRDAESDRIMTIIVAYNTMERAVNADIDLGVNL